LDKPVITLIKDPKGNPISPIEVNMTENQQMQIRVKLS
jgi:hypothetical protein